MTVGTLICSMPFVIISIFLYRNIRNPSAFVCVQFLDFDHILQCSLETTLRKFSCLTTGDTIMVTYNNKKYYLDVIETKPANAISIIETDCEVDFAPSLDYKVTTASKTLDKGVYS